MLELALIVVAFLLVAAVSIHFRARIATLEDVDRRARADLSASLAEVARSRSDVGERLDALLERERAVAEREDACERLAEETAGQRVALYKMSKAINRDVANWAHETRAEAERSIEEGRCLRADARQANEQALAVANDPRIRRLLRRGD